jgi:hypothetical protein
MDMNLSVAADVIVRLDDETTDELRSLRAWLVGEDELRGRVTMVEQPPRPGELGPVTDALLVALGQGGAATVLAAGLVSWLRSRHGDINITAERRGDQTKIQVSAKRVRGLDADGLRSEIDRLGHALSNGLPPGNDPGSPNPADGQPAGNVTQRSVDPGRAGEQTPSGPSPTP